MSIKDLIFGTVRARSFPAPVDAWPDTVTVKPAHLSCGGTYSSSFVLVGYPAQLPLAWLEPVANACERIDVSIHIDTIDPVVAASRLRRRRARLESSRRVSASHARLDDPAVEAAAEDAAHLAGRVARGDTRLHTLGVYVTVHAPSLQELAQVQDQVTAAATAMMLQIAPATFRQLPAITSTAPMGTDAVGVTRVVDTDVAAASFPFASADTPDAPGGVLYGMNLATGSPVMWDRWACDNHNSVVVARSGAGKSYFTKTEVLRQLYRGAHVTVIDPDGEYQPLASHIDATVVTPGAPGTGLNPLALPAASHRAGDSFTRRVMFAHTVIATAIGRDLTSDEAAACDAAVLEAYRAAGITPRQSTWNNTPPTVVDVATCLGDHGDAGRHLQAQLRPLVDGGLSSLFTTNTQATVDSAHPATVFDLRQLPDELTGVATLIILDSIWQSIRHTHQRHLVVVDEAWRLLSHTHGATFLSRMAKSCRKHGAGLMVVTQDADDMLSTQLGHVVIANAATQILMRQASQSLDQVAAAFGLTDAERDLVATATQGDALLVSGDTHVAFRAIASPSEHALLHTGLPHDHDDAGGVS